MSTSTSNTSLNLPQLILVLVLSGLAIRYFFFRPSPHSPSSPSARTRPPSTGRAANPQHVEQIAHMFPQVGRREIIWDLQRNGGSVAATTERILGRGLEVPPPSFQPPSLASSSPSRSPAPSSTTPSTHAIPQDLITRYNLASKIEPQAPTAATATAPAEAPKAGWSTSRNERQALLQRRREEMILSARRKMEERDRKAV
ncbi:hypothetical protein MMC26_003920 [Xylographa opegraphella]|nr:hypothetical protein [Xylographa opegraphella]